MVITSTEQRARESAKILSDLMEVPLSEARELDERHWGELSDTTWEEVKTRLDTMSIDERYEFQPSDGESWRMFEERLVDAVKKIVTMYQGKTVLIVVHGGVIRALIPWLTESALEESLKHDPVNGSISRFVCDSSGCHAEIINDNAHLNSV